VGAATAFSARIDWDLGGGFVLSTESVQSEVRPGPRGVLLLEADSVLILTRDGDTLAGLDPWGEFHTVGFENADCSL